MASKGDGGVTAVDPVVRGISPGLRREWNEKFPEKRRLLGPSDSEARRDALGPEARNIPLLLMRFLPS